MAPAVAAKAALGIGQTIATGLETPLLEFVIMPTGKRALKRFPDGIHVKIPAWFVLLCGMPLLARAMPGIFGGLFGDRVSGDAKKALDSIDKRIGWGQGTAEGFLGAVPGLSGWMSGTFNQSMEDIEAKKQENADYRAAVLAGAAAVGYTMLESDYNSLSVATFNRWLFAQPAETKVAYVTAFKDELSRRGRA